VSLHAARAVLNLRDRSRAVGEGVCSTGRVASVAGAATVAGLVCAKSVGAKSVALDSAIAASARESFMSAAVLNAIRAAARHGYDPLQ
jgi:hypothetical protein